MQGSDILNVREEMVAKESDQTRKENLGRAYKEMTGIDIQTRLARLSD